MILPPYRGAKRGDITQGFHEKHLANDFAIGAKKMYGLPLLSPMDGCTVKHIQTPGQLITDPETGKEWLRKGYGIRLVRGATEVLYWHCLPVFPVSDGQICKSGDVVAFVGNSGYVLVGGKYVPVDDRLSIEHPGTHLHLEMKQNNVLIDPSTVIDWTASVSTPILDYARAVIQAALFTITKIKKILA